MALEHILEFFLKTLIWLFFFYGLQLQSQLERLTESNKELRKKHSQISHQMRALVEERADLQASLQEQSRNVTALNKRLGLAQRDNQDLVQSQVLYLINNKPSLLLIYCISFWSELIVWKYPSNVDFSHVLLFVKNPKESWKVCSN